MPRLPAAFFRVGAGRPGSASSLAGFVDAAGESAFASPAEAAVFSSAAGVFACGDAGFATVFLATFLRAVAFFAGFAFRLAPAPPAVAGSGGVDGGAGCSGVALAGPEAVSAVGAGAATRAGAASVTDPGSVAAVAGIGVGVGPGDGSGVGAARCAGGFDGAA